MIETWEYIKASAPVLVALILYFVRIETRFARIETHLKWIKAQLNPKKVGENTAVNPTK